MRYTKIAVLAAVAWSVASAVTPADARHAKRGWTLGVIRTSSGYVYGPHYGYPTYPSFWYGPTSGVYPVDPNLCYVPRGYPYHGLWPWQEWQWALEYVC
jgi:hypothetical protein